jgi:hypothetical protein
VAVLRGCDVNKPRNLAKSVTVGKVQRDSIVVVVVVVVLRAWKRLER